MILQRILNGYYTAIHVQLCLFQRVNHGQWKDYSSHMFILYRYFSMRQRKNGIWNNSFNFVWIMMICVMKLLKMERNSLSGISFLILSMSYICNNRYLICTVSN